MNDFITVPPPVATITVAGNVTASNFNFTLVDTNSNITLTCTSSVSANFPVTYLYNWFSSTTNTSGIRLEGTYLSSDNTLYINKVNASNAGDYYCNVTASYESVYVINSSTNYITSLFVIGKKSV